MRWIVALLCIAVIACSRPKAAPQSEKPRVNATASAPRPLDQQKPLVILCVESSTDGVAAASEAAADADRDDNARRLVQETDEITVELPAPNHDEPAAEGAAELTRVLRSGNMPHLVPCAPSRPAEPLGQRPPR